MKYLFINKKDNSEQIFESTSSLITFLVNQTFFQDFMTQEFDAYIDVVYKGYVVMGKFFSVKDILIKFNEYESALKDYIDLTLTFISNSLERMEVKEITNYWDLFKIQCIE